MARDREQDRRDWEAIQARRQAERDAARDRAHQAAAAEEQERITDADRKAQGEFLGLLREANGMTDAELSAAIKKYGRKTGRKLTNADKDKIKRARQTGGGCLGMFLVIVVITAAVLYGAYEGVTALAGVWF